MKDKKVKICYMLPHKIYDKGKYAPTSPLYYEASLREFIAELEKNKLFEHIEGWMTDHNEILIYAVRESTYGSRKKKINWKEIDKVY